MVVTQPNTLLAPYLEKKKVEFYFWIARAGMRSETILNGKMIVSISVFYGFHNSGKRGVKL